MIIPKKLKSGDEIHVIAPSRSMAILPDECKNLAIQRLSDLGFKVSFGKHVLECDEFGSSFIDSRVEDLHAAFADKNVKGILTVIGGFNVNQILKYLDYDLIKKNSKVLCGYSDITALSNSIYAKTGLVNYSGLHFSTFGMQKHFEYNLEYFKKCLMEEESFNVLPSPDWSDDAWFLDQEKRNIMPNDGYWIINEGEAQGKILGGNLCTFNLLQGTEFMPDLEESILFLENDNIVANYFSFEFDRDLQSLIHQPGFEKVCGIVFGRFQKSSNLDRDKMKKIIKNKKELKNIPIIANADFGHTNPLFTFPIGGEAKIISSKEQVSITIEKH